MGQDTWNRLFPASSSASVNPPATAVDNSEINPQLAPANFPVLKRGMRGETVRDLQERLRAKGFLRSSADGVFRGKPKLLSRRLSGNINYQPTV